MTKTKTTDRPLLVTGFGDDPISYDLGVAHMNGTDKIRAAIARVGIANPGAAHSVIAVSIISAGDGIEDQLIVYSPGGRSEGNARTLLARLEKCVAHVEFAIEKRNFDKF